MSTEHEEIEYLPQSVNYLGTLAKELGALHGITTLANELLQNADDAKNEAGDLAATIVTFDVTDEAFVITNDACFRESDFKRLQEVSSASKRFEGGARTTGAFGIGFIAVYQVTDRPEIISSGRHWSLRPEEDESTRIKVRWDDSITPDQGTKIRLPWAFTDSEVRRKLRVQPVDRNSLETFVEDLKIALPRSILFLKNLESIELKRGGETIMTISRTIQNENIEVKTGEITKSWRILRGQFNDEATEFRRKYKQYVEENRNGSISLAVPGSSIDDGILYATLPTEQSTGLPFHIDADFYPISDRKGIIFGDELDYRSVWNRLALAAAADALGENFEEILLLHKSDHKSLWNLLDRLHKVHNDHQEDDLRPLGAFWEAIVGDLKTLPIVFTESMEWRLPNKVRIATGREEESIIPIFEALGIEMSNNDLRSFRNLLTSNEIGVGMISAADLHSALSLLNLVDGQAETKSLPDGYQSESGVLEIWKALRLILIRTGSDDSIALLARCSLAMCMDGSLLPFKRVFRANAETRELFSSIGAGIHFLVDVESEEIVAELLCPEFTAENAIEQLSIFDAEHFETLWRDGVFNPASLIRWFQDNAREFLDYDYFGESLSELPIYPSGGNLRPLTALAMPGNFVDPLGLSELVDIEQLSGLKDFLQSLGAEDLTFVDYVKDHVPIALMNREIDSEDKRRLLELIGLHIGEISDDNSIKESLGSLPIVECDDGNFRRPEEVYFKTELNNVIFGKRVCYVRSEDSETGKKRDLYRWLGVSEHPRPEDVIRIIINLSSKPPDQTSKRMVNTIIEALGREWDQQPPRGLEKYQRLQELKWLPAEGDSNEWHKPGDLFASFVRAMFESQATFLDTPLIVQQRASDFLEFIDVNPAPVPAQVVRHLLVCAKDDRDPPGGIYDYLNNTAQENDLVLLKNALCLRLDESYYRPDQVYWGDHPFGRFRKRLGGNFKNVNRFLPALGVRESPNHSDAIRVLGEISSEFSHSPLGDDRESVMNCWIMLSEAISNGDLVAESLRDILEETECVPNQQQILYKPSWMFFEDRPGLAGKFDEFLSTNTIVKPERAWPAMKAAGVRPITSAVTGSIVESSAAMEDHDLKKRLTTRAGLLKRIIDRPDGSGADDGGVEIDDIKFIRSEGFRVIWQVDAFGKTVSSEPEPATAHRMIDQSDIYFALDNGDYPWTGLSRELAMALAPGVEVRMVSPGIKVVLETNDEQQAATNLNDLGIAAIEIASFKADSDASTVEEFDEDQESIRIDEEDEESDDAFTNFADDQETTASGDLEARPEPEPTDLTNHKEQIENSSASDHGRFVEKLFDVQTHGPSRAADLDIVLPAGGPDTKRSAKEDTEKSFRIGRQGSQVPKQVFRWEPIEAAKMLADRFRQMALGDYAKRCQICSRTFQARNGDHQAFILHLVQPSAHPGTNNYGDLVSLCGWHYALIHFGQWEFLDPETNAAIQDTERLQEILLAAEPLNDDLGNPYVGLTIRFYNVFEDRGQNPATVDEDIRYSEPHWKYLLELFKA